MQFRQGGLAFICETPEDAEIVSEFGFSSICGARAQDLWRANLEDCSQVYLVCENPSSDFAMGTMAFLNGNPLYNGKPVFHCLVMPSPYKLMEERSLQDAKTAFVQAMVAAPRFADIAKEIYERKPKKKRFQFIDSLKLAITDYKLDYIVNGVLVKNQPAIFGGPMKTLKTNIATDLAVSISSGSPFLGKFVVPQKKRVAFISGESGEATLQNAAERVCHAKGVYLGDCLLHWCFELPQLHNPMDLEELFESLLELQIDVLLVDPIYLCLLGAGDVGNASNLFAMGPLMRNLSSRAVSYNITPIFIHHFKKGRDNFAEPSLEDLSFAGFQEFARQWILLGRRERYEPDSGESKLWMNVGGSAGHGGAYALDIVEGVIGDDLGGRKWIVDIYSANEAKEGQKEARQRERQEDKQAAEIALEDDLARAIDCLDPEMKGIGEKRVRDYLGWNSEKFKRIAASLRRKKILKDCQVSTQLGNNATRMVNGIIRVE